ncbi:hypothetical protein DYB37_013791 [Aphanomyces astaci]|uniref:Sideroflexin n=2 Tax=Aphanomyces astaci TaxID=112090 RepID=A0A3R6YQJ3_APHAT|nr:hypothetical protein DYB35_012429 [Aphanomyces astaci]RHZ21553.1 hypothetical protein DYB37_013791 [Aphanomyces astaci]
MAFGGGSADESTEARETKPRFLADPDEATYWQRVKKTWEMLDFRTAFATAADVQAAKSVVLNQTYNALHYYANRNATNEDTSNQRIAAYVGATASSVAASSEFRRGVNIYDEQGEWVGLSKLCGVYAVSSCIGGRILAAAPILMGPPLIMQLLEARTTLFHGHRRRFRVPATLFLVGLLIQTSVPLTFGLFRQSAQVDTQYIETEFQGRVHANGHQIRTVTYNKGI